MCEWTPPYETRPTRCMRPPRSCARGVLEERPVADGAVDALEILVDDPARADGEVADLGVALLAGRKPDRLARRGERPVRVRAPHAVEHRRVGELDRVAGAGGGTAPPVQDHERDERRGHRTAARQIAANEPGSSEAPPTSAPSTSGSPSSSAAFSGFTEPP